MSARRELSFVIMAAGTGGHVYPALAVAQRLRAGGARVVWFGTRRGLEARVAPGAGFRLYTASVGGLRGKGVLRWVLAPLPLLAACIRAARVLVRVRPRVVLGMGGYGSGPGGLTARLLGYRLVVHEQNAVPGLTNRLLAPLATRVLEAFPGSFPPARGAVHTGNPLRAGIARIQPPAARLGTRKGSLRVLVLGGSQGASILNAVVPRSLAELDDPRAVDVHHQCGERHLDVTRAAYAGSTVRVRVEAFIEDMADAYAWADIVICRAGAMTVSELSAAGVASILVPFPYATDDHQSLNARYLADRGAALLVPQAALTPRMLARLVGELCVARERVRAMAQAARRLAVADATEQVAANCWAVAHA